MKIKYFNSLNSTQIYIKEYIKKNGYTQPLCFVTQNQTNGIGSRNNNWTGREGNLFFSFVLNSNLLPKDLPLQSISIYFSFILKDTLTNLGSKVKLKWPNDFYIDNKKIGGTMTSLSGNCVYCGIGLNLFLVNNKFGTLDIDLNIEEFLNKYFQALKRYPSWKQIISQFKIEFYHNNNFETHIEKENVLLKDTTLQYDGSLLVDGKKVFSLR